MGARTTIFSVGEYYHIYNRGVDKRSIFQDVNDYQRFIDLLYLSHSINAISYRDIKAKHKNVFEYDFGERTLSVGAYCLMPNHFHLLVRAGEDHDVTKFINKLCTGYSMYFNKKYERNGALFQGRFQSKHADSDEYLKYLFSYIHLNPQKLLGTQIPEDRPRGKEVVERLKDYRWSSLVDYFGSEREERKILDKGAFPEYFMDEKELEAELFEWINYDELS